ncbi:MAG: S41 family peptidase, partial [Ignavibacteriota bacterium]
MKLSLYSPKRLAFVGMVLVITSALLGARIDKALSTDNAYEEINKYSDVLNLVQKNYVDKVSLSELNEAAIVGLLAKLDPHSVYMPPKNVKKSAEEFEGKFQGIGVRFAMSHDSVLVDEVIPGGPSDMVGLIAGDKIFSIDGKKTTGFTEDSVIKHLRGPKGTKVSVGIARSGMPMEGTGQPKPLNFEITRDDIPLYSVLAHFMVDDHTGYIELSRFIQTSHEEMVKNLEDLKSQGMEKLILDLRDNPGGYLEQAVQIADEFIGGTKTLVFTKGRVSNFDDIDVSHPGQAYEKVPLVVLVNSGSASASEIFSGAMQDLDRAPIVGATTFGKGLVQRQFALQDQSALRLTVSRYYTPSGRSIQRPYEGGKYKKGIQNDDEDEELDNFSHSKEVGADDTTRPKFKTPSGRTIYGGGGISPDYFVKEDTLTKSSIRLYAASILYDYTKEQISMHAPELKKRYTADSFVKEFRVGDDVIAKLLEHAKEKKVDFDPKEIETDKDWILMRLRMDIGRQLFGDNVYFRIRIEKDKQFQKAYSLMSEAQKMALS